MNLKKLFSYPLILFLFSFFIRIFLIGKGPYSVDALNIALLGEKTLDTLELQYLFGTGYPLIIILSAISNFFARLISVTDPIITVNYMAALFGALCVPVFYLFIKRLFDHTTAFFSALLLSLCPILYGLSTFGMNHMPALFFLLISLLFLIKYLDSHEKKQLFLSGMFLGFLGATRLQDLVLTFVAISFFFFFYKSDAQSKSSFKQKCLSFLCFVFFIAITTIIFHMPYLIGESRHAYLDQFRSYRGVTVAANDPEVNIIAAKLNLLYLFQTLSPLGLLLSITGSWLMIKPHTFTYRFLCLWIFLPLLFFINIYTIVPRFQTVILPPILIAQGYLIARFYCSKGFTKWAIVCIFLLNTYLTIGHYLPHFVYRHKNAIIIDYLKWLKFHTEEDSRIIATDLGRFLPYYAQRKGYGRQVRANFAATYAEMAEWKKDVYTMIDKGTPMYITETGLYTYDFHYTFSDYVKANFELELVGTHLYEDWHRGCLLFKVFPNKLYRMKKKQ